MSKELKKGILIGLFLVALLFLTGCVQQPGNYFEYEQAGDVCPISSNDLFMYADDNYEITKVGSVTNPKWNKAEDFPRLNVREDFLSPSPGDIMIGKVNGQDFQMKVPCVIEFELYCFNEHCGIKTLTPGIMWINGADTDQPMLKNKVNT